MLNSGTVTADLRPAGRPATTTEVGEAVCAAIYMSKPRTIIEKIWDSHVVAEKPGAPALLYIDLHLVHEVTSPQAFDGLRRRGLKVRRPDLTLATADHSVPTTDRSLPIVDPISARQIAQLEAQLRRVRHPLHGLDERPPGHRARDRPGARASRSRA